MPRYCFQRKTIIDIFQDLARFFTAAQLEPKLSDFSGFPILQK